MVDNLESIGFRTADPLLTPTLQLCQGIKGNFYLAYSAVSPFWLGSERIRASWQRSVETDVSARTYPVLDRKRRRPVRQVSWDASFIDIASGGMSM